ncbi:hypothetical protein RRG08_043625 [Elysia crispata]|uniref:Uncharacterized protein n=1 Tax=Elysia crispata TaxID=231223 RepID=A0AAE1A5L3_9GAST|nr:hypothetical protein RRG08_043625 [Elysia crispata]
MLDKLNYGRYLARKDSRNRILGVFTNSGGNLHPLKHVRVYPTLARLRPSSTPIEAFGSAHSRTWSNQDLYQKPPSSRDVSTTRYNKEVSPVELDPRGQYPESALALPEVTERLAVK